MVLLLLLRVVRRLDEVSYNGPTWLPAAMAKRRTFHATNVTVNVRYGLCFAKKGIIVVVTTRNGEANTCCVDKLVSTVLR